MPSIATNRSVDRAEVEAFVAERHHGVLVTMRADGRPQTSPVTIGVSARCGARGDLPGAGQGGQHPPDRHPRRCSCCPTSSTARGCRSTAAAEVVDLPEAEDGLVEYFRVISGEHPDWDEYRRAMRDQGKCLLRISIDEWGPIATGGFPPDVAARMT